MESTTLKNNKRIFIRILLIIILSFFICLVKADSNPTYPDPWDQDIHPCINNMQDIQFGETGIDCGGICEPCNCTLNSGYFNIKENYADIIIFGTKKCKDETITIDIYKVEEEFELIESKEIKFNNYYNNLDIYYNSVYIEYNPTEDELTVYTFVPKENGIYYFSAEYGNSNIRSMNFFDTNKQQAQTIPEGDETTEQMQPTPTPLEELIQAIDSWIQGNLSLENLMNKIYSWLSF